MIRWTTAFLDLPADRFDEGTRFWQAVTGSTLSAMRGDDGEFATLLSAEGDPYIRVQRVAGSGGVHLDLHVDDVAELAEVARARGATVAAHRGFVVMRSPGGFAFCVVHHHGETERPAPLASESGATSLVDQVSIDVPHDRYEAEVEFWGALTGWPAETGRLPEFTPLDRPSGQPLRLIVQRLDDDDPAGSARGHLDLACGESVAVVAAEHVVRGASIRRVERYWTTMVDPAGLEYCLTRRDPFAGTLP